MVLFLSMTYTVTLYVPLVPVLGNSRGVSPSSYMLIMVKFVRYKFRFFFAAQVTFGYVWLVGQEV